VTSVRPKNTARSCIGVRAKADAWGSLREYRGKRNKTGQLETRAGKWGKGNEWICWMIFRMLSRERMGRAAKRVLICRLRGHPEMGGKGLGRGPGDEWRARGGGGRHFQWSTALVSRRRRRRAPAAYSRRGTTRHRRNLEVTRNGRVAAVSHSPVPCCLLLSLHRADCETGDAWGCKNSMRVCNNPAVELALCRSNAAPRACTKCAGTP
jgi:hypothetical protein